MYLNDSSFSDNIYICIHKPNNGSKFLESRIDLHSDLTSVFFKDKIVEKKFMEQWRGQVMSLGVIEL